MTLSLCILVISPAFSIISGSDGESTKELNNNFAASIEPKNNDTGMDESTRGTSGGELEWIYSDPDGGVVSTPALVDLDNDGFLEVVFATSNDRIIGLNHDGSKRWRNQNYIFKTVREFQSDIGLNYYAPELFSSITAANIDRDIRPELVISGYNGLIFLNHDGEPKFVQAHSGRLYFTTPVITDLEGDYSSIDMNGNKLTGYKDLEVATGSVDVNQNAFLETWHVTGGDIFDSKVSSADYQPFMVALAAGDLDGSMEDGIYYQNEEAWMELVFATYSKPMRIYHRDGTSWSSAHGHNHPVYNENKSFTKTGVFSYATPAVGNFSKKTNNTNPSQLEIIIGVGGWTDSIGSNPDTTGAGLYCLTEDGEQKWHSLNNTVIAGSPAVCDVQGKNLDDKTKHLAEFEVFTGNSHEGEFFCVDADNGTVLWSWELDGAKSTSNRILSSPAICDINSDKQLEVVVGSNNGKVYMFDGDPTDGVNEGKKYPMYTGEGTNKFDLLWEFDTHDYNGTGSIGISSPVVADIDKDGMLEVVIGDNGGRVYCISAGGSSSRGQRDWTMFHSDLNNSGLYKQLIKYGVTIKSARDPVTGLIDSREKFASPGQMITYNLSVMNDGLGTGLEDFDIMYLSTYISSSTNNPGWKYTLGGNDIRTQDGLKYVKLRMQEETVIHLNVTAPFSAELGDYISINVLVNSSKALDAWSSITTLTHIGIKIDFNLGFNWLRESDPLSPYYGKKIDYLLPEEEKIYTVVVQNTGTINDSYRISIVDYERGWDIEWVDAPDGDKHNITVELDSSIWSNWGAENITQLKIRVRVPENWVYDDVTFITFEGVSQVSEAEQSKPHPLIGLIKRSDTMLIKTKANPGLNIEVIKPSLYFLPGEQQEFQMMIDNTGNVDFTVTLKLNDLTPGWIAKMQSSVDIRTEYSKIIPVQVTAPTSMYQAFAGNMLNFSVTGIVETSEFSLNKTVFFTGIIKTVNKLNVTSVIDYNETTAGGTVYYLVNVANEGNDNNTVYLSTESINKGWSLSFPMGRQFLLGFSNNFTIKLEVIVPASAEPGLYYTILNVSGNGPGEVNLITFTTRVNYYDLNVDVFNTYNSMFLSSTTETIKQGSYKISDFKVTNDGYSEDEAELKFYLQKYTKAGVVGSLATKELTAKESDSLLKTQNRDTEVRWYINALQSANINIITNASNFDFRNIIEFSTDDEITYLPSGLAVYTTDARVRLLPGQSVYVKVRIDYPFEETMDPMHFRLEVKSRGFEPNTANNHANLIIDVLHPDLTYDPTTGGTGIEINGRRSIDTEKLDIIIHVRNIGKTAAEDIEVALYIDNKYISSRFIDRLENSTIGSYVHRYVIFSWKPETSGSYNIKLVIDPQEQIEEEEENNNEVSTNIKISGVVEEDTLSIRIGGVLALIIIVIVLLFIIMWPFLKRRWPTGTLEEELSEELAEETKGLKIVESKPKLPKHIPAYKCTLCGSFVPNGEECKSCTGEGDKGVDVNKKN